MEMIQVNEILVDEDCQEICQLDVRFKSWSEYLEEKGRKRGHWLKGCVQNIASV